MKNTLLTSAAAGAILAAGFASSAMADGHATDLTLCWAAWDPANALVELSKDFEAQSGHTMNFEFVPWTSFADRMLNELNSGGQLCDLMIGDLGKDRCEPGLRVDGFELCGLDEGEGDCHGFTTTF